MNERSGRAMSREEIRKVLGNGIDELHIEMLEALGTTGIDVVHLRPLLAGRANLMKGERNKLRKAHYASGGQRLFTGHQMAGHLRTVRKTGFSRRFYFAPTGGETRVEIVTSRGTFEGFAKCSEEDLFCRATGRRLAFTRALLNAWAPIRPKPQLASGGKVPQGSLLTDAIAAAAKSFNAAFKSMSFELDPSIRLKARSLSKLHKAENLDKALIAGVDEEERPHLEDRARVLREQAIADAAVASRLTPQRLLLDLRDQLEEKIKECHKWAESLQRNNDDSGGAEQFLIEANALENVVSLLPPKAEAKQQA